MAKFLRDQQFQNLNIDENLLRQLVSTFQRLLIGNPEYVQNDQNNVNGLVIITIRFDEKGYRTFTIAEVLEYFNQAKVIERVILEIATQSSVNSNRNIGSYIDLRFDNISPSFLTISSDYEAWVNEAFSSITYLLTNSKNKYGLIRNEWIGLLIQIFGVFIGFLISLSAAVKISPYIIDSPYFKNDSSFLIIFFFVFLIFSNFWTQISPILKKTLNRLFPAFRFQRKGKDQLQWFYQSIVGGIVVAIILFLIDSSFNYIGGILGSYINK